MESIDDLLAQVKNEYQNPQKQPTELSLLAEELKSAASSTYQSQPVIQTRKSQVEDSLLAEIKAEFEEQQRIEARKKQEQLREAQNRQQKQEKSRKEALIKEAKEWLKTLDFGSEEGLWFEEFSYSYPSKLEAALDYLQALRETNR